MLDKFASDKLQIVWLKEMRQTLASKILYLIAAITILMDIIFIYGYLTAEDQYHTIAYTFTCCLVIAVFIGMLTVAHRSYIERFEEGLDPMFCTQLKPIQVVWGKTLAMWTMGALIIVLALPAIIIVQKPQGELERFFGLLMAFGAAQCLLWSCMINHVKNKKNIHFAGLVIIIPLLCVLVMAVEYCEQFTIINFVFFLYVFLAIIALFFTLNVSLLRRQSWDRAKPSRIVLVILSLILIPLWILFCQQNPSEYNFFSPLILICGVIFLVSSSERLLPTPRMIQDRPRNLILQILSYPFTGGATNGILLGVIFCLVACIVDVITFPENNIFIEGRRFELWLTAYCIFYSGIVVFLRSCFKMSQLKAWMVIIIVCFLPSFITAFQDIEVASILNPIFGAVADCDYYSDLLSIVSITGILLAITPAVEFIKAYNPKDDN